MSKYARQLIHNLVMSGNLRFSVALLKYAVPAPLSYQHDTMLFQMLYELISFHFSFYAESWLTQPEIDGHSVIQLPSSSQLRLTINFISNSQSQLGSGLEVSGSSL